MPQEPYILVVDDEPMVLGMVSTTLEEAGFRVTTATDAWQEVIQAQGLKICLLISDILMPGVGSGVDALKKLRNLPAVSPKLPVIFMTGMRPDKAREMVPQDDPYVRLIFKPIDFEQLRAAIKELTGIDRPL